MAAIAGLCERELVLNRAERRRGVDRSLVAEMECYLTSRGCRSVIIARHGPYFAVRSGRPEDEAFLREALAST